MYAMTFNQALIKGHPEYRDTQARGDDGKWTGDGGSTSRGKAPRKPRGGINAEYKRRFGHAPPKNMSAEAKRRWINSDFKSAPKDFNAAQAKQEAVKIKADLDAAQELLAEAKTKQENVKEAAQRVLDGYDHLRNLDDGVWYEPTFADELLKSLTTFDWLQILFMITAPTVYGGVVAVTGLYLMMRYVYRKARTLGRYRGVRPD